MAFNHNSEISANEPDWGSVDKTRLPRNAFADPGEPDKKSTWAYPHHWIADAGGLDESGVYTTGRMYLHRGGLNAAWAAAQGAHTGEKASAAVIAHLQEHRRAIGAGEPEARQRFIRTSAIAPDIDQEKRILRNVVAATRSLGSDGWIIIPEGIDLTNYRRNPIVQALHGGAAMFVRSPVIGRSLSMTVSAGALSAEVQFADTQLGREYAYLYGINPDRERYMRAWSVAGPILESEDISWAAAREEAGSAWDEAAAERLSKLRALVHVARRFDLQEFSAVPIGADRGALTRAAAAGIRTAGDIIVEMDLWTATEEIAAIKREQTARDERLAKLERDIQALRGDGASAAARGDSEAVLAGIRTLRLMLRRNAK